MFLTITNLGTRTSSLMRAPLTVPILHAIAGAFISNDDDVYTVFQAHLQTLFHKQEFSTYCIDHLPGSAALITFSSLASPLTYTYKNKSVRVRPPDVADFALFIQELSLSKTPSSFTSDRKGYTA